MGGKVIVMLTDFYFLLEGWRWTSGVLDMGRGEGREDLASGIGPDWKQDPRRWSPETPWQAVWLVATGSTVPDMHI